MSTSTERVAARPGGMRRIAVAAGFGNFMEWFDFAVYGFFAVTIGHVFFPSDNPTTELLSALAVFGVAFFMRPLGGVILGNVGDRVGRRAALAASVLLMGVSTTLVAVLPTYESVGLLAPVLLVVLRCAAGPLGRWRVGRLVVVPRRVRPAQPPRAVGQRRHRDRRARVAGRRARRDRAHHAG